MASRAAKIDRVHRSMETLKDNIEDLTKLAKEVAAESVEVAEQGFSQIVRNGKDKATDAKDRLEKKVRHHPLQSVLIAGGIGFLIGLLRR